MERLCIYNCKKDSQGESFESIGEYGFLPRYNDDEGKHTKESRKFSNVLWSVVVGPIPAWTDKRQRPK